MRWDLKMEKREAKGEEEKRAANKIIALKQSTGSPRVSPRWPRTFFVDQRHARGKATGTLPSLAFRLSLRHPLGLGRKKARVSDNPVSSTNNWLLTNGQWLVFRRRLWKSPNDSCKHQRKIARYLYSDIVMNNTDVFTTNVDCGCWNEFLHGSCDFQLELEGDRCLSWNHHSWCDTSAPRVTNSLWSLYISRR